jgi:PadR family transcriptional regulator PadR
MEFGIAGNLLDACVLGALANGPAYGYELTLKTQTELNVSESTLYPVLRRLLKNEYLSSYDEPYDGRNRRYYQLTAKGDLALREYRLRWQLYKENIDKFLVIQRNDDDNNEKNEEDNDLVYNEQD